jgi:hypothetical protein
MIEIEILFAALKIIINNRSSCLIWLKLLTQPQLLVLLTISIDFKENSLYIT